MATNTPRYSIVLFDLDDTLLDSAESARLAFDDAMESIGVNDADIYRPVFRDINADLWGKVETGELTPNEVKTLRFEQLVALGGFATDPLALADIYGHGLGRYGNLYPGAHEMLATVSDVATLGIITNGIGEIQRSRLVNHDLEQYFDDVVISGEVGHSKPGSRIFDVALDRLGRPEKSTVVMIGDSLSSDMPGAAAYGIDSIWFDTLDRTVGDVPVTHRVSSLLEIPPIVLG